MRKSNGLTRFCYECVMPKIIRRNESFFVCEYCEKLNNLDETEEN